MEPSPPPVSLRKNVFVSLNAATIKPCSAVGTQQFTELRIGQVGRDICIYVSIYTARKRHQLDIFTWSFQYRSFKRDAIFHINMIVSVSFVEMSS
jgi:hypothetical protein